MDDSYLFYYTIIKENLPRAESINFVTNYNVADTDGVEVQIETDILSRLQLFIFFWSIHYEICSFLLYFFIFPIFCYSSPLVAKIKS